VTEFGVSGFARRRGEAESAAKDIDEITGDVLNAAIAIHRDVGPGLFETVYETLLAAKLEALGYRVLRQHPVDIRHDDFTFEAAFKLDLFVDHRLVVEIKAVDGLKPVHYKQVLTFLRILKQPVGLLINFNEALLKDGFKRVVNDHRASASPRLRVNQIDRIPHE
jgi:GxxExxY protein